MCQFCGMQDPKFMNKDYSDEHLAYTCPMLGACPACDMVRL